ncbi:MAG: hypothetical protein AAF587_36285 [Bacteroidota bacterium]
MSIVQLFLRLFLTICAGFLFSASAPLLAQGNAEEGPKHYYVSKNTGRGRIASKAQPAKDLGNIIALLKAGDVVHLAEGTYLSRGERGADEIKVPISLIGGYDPTFSTRDPWGEHKTIFSGTNHIEGLTTPRLHLNFHLSHKAYQGEVLIDGLIIDNGNRNRYMNEEKLAILRTANMRKEENATPGMPGIKINAAKNTQVIVRNCVLLNVASSQGVISVQIGENAQASINNNLIVNNTGNGIQAMTSWHPRDGKGLPTFHIFDNTILFCWKHDPVATYGGNCLKVDTDIQLLAENNVFGFGDFGGIDNIKKCKSITLKDNLLTGHRKYDYREWNTKMNIEEIEDESDLLSFETIGNVGYKIDINIDPEWANIYANRPEISRAEVDAKAVAVNSDANALRGMLGISLRANAVQLDSDVWLHHIELDDVIKTGLVKYEGKFGCELPEKSR